MSISLSILAVSLRRFVPVVAVLLAGPAAAGEYAARSVEGWTVAASRDGNGCFLTREHDGAGGTTVLLGLDVDGATRLTMLDPDWSIAPRDRLELTFRLSAASFPKRFAVGIASDGKRGFVTGFDARFPAQFAASRTLEVFRGDVPVARLSLAGSGAAVAALRSCVAARRGAAASARGARAIPKDPFASGRR